MENWELFYLTSHSKHTRHIMTKSMRYLSDYVGNEFVDKGIIYRYKGKDIEDWCIYLFILNGFKFEIFSTMKFKLEKETMTFELGDWSEWEDVPYLILDKAMDLHQSSIEVHCPLTFNKYMRRVYSLYKLILDGVPSVVLVNPSSPAIKL